MHDEQILGIVTDTLEKALEFEKKNPEYSSIYSVELNKPIADGKDEDGNDYHWGKWEA